MGSSALPADCGVRRLMRSAKRWGGGSQSHRPSWLSPDADQENPVLIGLLAAGWLTFRVAAPRLSPATTWGPSPANLVVANRPRRLTRDTRNRFVKAASTLILQLFLVSPRNLVFSMPNCCLMTRNGCSTLARICAFAASIRSCCVPSAVSGSARRFPSPAASPLGMLPHGPPSQVSWPCPGRRRRRRRPSPHHAAARQPV